MHIAHIHLDLLISVWVANIHSPFLWKFVAMQKIKNTKPMDYHTNQTSLAQNLSMMKMNSKYMYFLRCCCR